MGSNLQKLQKTFIKIFNIKKKNFLKRKKQQKNHGQIENWANKLNFKKFIIFMMITSFIVGRMPNMRSSLLDF